MSAHFAKTFFSFGKCQCILQRYFSVLGNASAFCKAIFQFWEMPAHFAKTFFSFGKCQRILQKHFSVLRNASAFCKDIFRFWEMPAHFAKMSFPDFGRRFFYSLAETVYDFLFPCVFTLLQLTSIL